MYFYDNLTVHCRDLHSGPTLHHRLQIRLSQKSIHKLFSNNSKNHGCIQMELIRDLALWQILEEIKTEIVFEDPAVAKTQTDTPMC